MSNFVWPWNDSYVSSHGGNGIFMRTVFYTAVDFWPLDEADDSCWGQGRCHLLFEMHHIKAEGSEYSPKPQTWQWLLLLFWHDRTERELESWPSLEAFFHRHKEPKRFLSKCSNLVFDSKLALILAKYPSSILLCVTLKCPDIMRVVVHSQCSTYPDIFIMLCIQQWCSSFPKLGWKKYSKINKT